MRYPIVLLLSRLAFASPFKQIIATAKSRHNVPEPGSPEFYYKLIISAGLVLAGGVFAGYLALPLQC